MDKRRAISLVRRYVNNIRSDYHVKKAFLFGSFARGNFHPDSDIDVAIILPGKVDIFETRVNLMKMRWDLDSRIEPHPIAESEFNSSNALASEVIKYGIPIEIND